MAKVHGRNGLLYLGSATAIAVANCRSEDLGLATDFADASSQGDTFKSKLPGLSDFTLKLSKWYTDTYFVMYDAVLAQTVMKCYFYPDRNATGNYFWGQVYLGLDSFKADSNATEEESWSVVPASSMQFTHT